MNLSTGNPATHDISSLNDGMEGSCLCGKITIKITQEGLFDKPNGGICHCYNCRQFSGAASANLLLVPTENVHISDPFSSLKTYNDTNTASGRMVPRSFCSNCGSSLGILPLCGHPQTSIVMLGLFPRIPEPEFECFTKHRQGWMKPMVAACGESEFGESVLKFNGHLLR
ncbi:hypothetical protein M409DRAFT_29338 [Zasmidium cellare ATCC 36951]|uniref:CENP-V/GFA domain-containing protein n=1 Tax=Zasmidium cellare ATCC 36951 TaxID=1080233 RepID=A0A6A6C1U3_ZASCE|nr:uncharacterized protein M409DRAFT_29338 [Zasmidium cellare ATCC 36951]KAF2160248.1 hypothetical protein M409DRAFT_29338 [Zasmidium cellare ATCC 36951]